MKQYQGLSGVLIGGLAIALVSQPASAAPTQVTGIQLSPVGGGINLIMQTQAGDRPQVFTVNRGTNWTADIINTQLRLPQGGTFRQDSPAPGIASITVAPLDANSIRVVVVGQNATPMGSVARRDASGLIFSVMPGGAAQVGATPGRLPNNTAISQVPASTSPPPTTAPRAIPVPPPSVPNPRIVVNAPPPVAPPTNLAPPFLPRASAPPVGDIAVATVSSAPNSVDLGSSERIPRLVLRDAPVRDVLSLLARAAGFNVAYVEPPAGQGGQAQAAGGESGGPKISLDIENESVQDVFNYVLRATCVSRAASGGGSTGSSGASCDSLEANLVGRTVFVGPKLPDDARNIITRTLRLNQASSIAAANFLVSQGAELQFPFTRVTIATIGSGNNAQNTRVEEPDIKVIKAERGEAPLILTGLSVAADSRINTVTLVGSPKKVEIATALLSQLDVRKRQVAINVKIVDVNLLATEDFGTSFSFGVGDSFFVNDNGAAVFNYGGYNPPNAATTANNVLSPPVVANPFASGNTFLNFNNGVNVPGTSPGTRTIVNDQEAGTFSLTETPGPGAVGTGTFPGTTPGVSTDPLAAGITQFTRATPNVVTTTITPGTPDRVTTVNGVTTVVPGTPRTVTTNFQPGNVGSVTNALPSFFRYPSKFLSLLQAQVVKGNAKILTDPTLIVQEGENANVSLTQDVITNISVQNNDTSGGTRQTRTFERTPAGLTLAIRLDRIDDNGFVSLAVNPTVTSPVSNFDTGSGTLTLLATRNLSSGQIRLRDGQTLILSGIIQETDRSTVSKIPLLGDIPILGALFRRTNRQNQRQEVIVLLTPQILDDSDRSSFGYSYTPGPDVRRILEQQNQQNR